MCWLEICRRLGPLAVQVRKGNRKRGGGGGPDGGGAGSGWMVKEKWNERNREERFLTTGTWNEFAQSGIVNFKIKYLRN